MIWKILVFILFLVESYRLDKSAVNNNIAGVIRGIFYVILYIIILIIIILNPNR